MRSLLDLVLQSCIRLAQLSRHAVELVGQRFELVPGMYLDLLLKIARTDALRAFLKDRDRTHHAACEGETRDHGCRKPKEDQ